MSLLRPAARLLSSRPALRTSLAPWRPFQSTAFQPPFRAPLFRPFSVSSFFRDQIPTAKTTEEDGLRNNRDLSNHKPTSDLSYVSRSDLDLLSKLPPAPHAREEVPSYAMVFTCKKCSERSAHKMSKQGYHQGTVLITCPSCKSRHLISDHLKIFSDTSVTIEDILAKKGEELNKLAINEDGDVEFWDNAAAVEDAPKALPAS